MSSGSVKLAGPGWQYGENILRLRHLAGHPSRNFIMEQHPTTQKTGSLLGIPPYGPFFTFIGKWGFYNEY